jgi:sigma-E factor negative regulatory protein RseC
MENEGIVKGVEGSRALVEVKKKAICESCPAKAACHLSQDEGFRQVWAENRAGARQGDMVVVSIEDIRVIKGSFVFYLIPILSLFIGAGIGKWLSGREALTSGIKNMAGNVLGGLLTSPDNLSIILGVIFLLMAFLLVWLYSRRAAVSGEFRPRVTRISKQA